MMLVRFFFWLKVVIRLMLLLSLTVRAETIIVTAAEYSTDWPFTVDQVTLSCRNVAAVLMQSPNGTTYWLNGKASAQFKQLPSWRELAKPDPRYGARAVMTPPSGIINRGLALCPK